MDRRRAAGLLLALAACFATATAAPTASNHTALDLYDAAPDGCYYNFQRYGQGDRIMTNEPCLNCTCHNRMLMCYLRVCPFTKPIGQDCTIEKRADQCCPIVTCPDVPVDLLTSTTTSPAEYGPTGMGKLDKFGCSINGKYFSEGSKVPPTPNKPCEHCYCIRNMTTCVMQECTLHVDGCTPIYHKDVCCPVRYSCDHPEDEMPLLDDLSTTVRPTPGFLLTTTTISPVTQMSQDCVYDNRIFPDGALIKTEKACDHCYCMKGDIVCVVQECGTPMENEGKNCTALPPREGVCCPDTYICEGDEPSTGTYVTDEITTHAGQEKLTTLSPPRRTSSEGSGYRNEPDEAPYTEPSLLEPEIEGSGEDEEPKPHDSISTEKPKPESTDDVLASTEETHEFIPLTTTKPKNEEDTKVEISKKDEDLVSIGDIEKTTEAQEPLPSTTGIYSTKDFEEPITDKTEDIGSGESPPGEDVNLKPHEEVLVTPVLPDTVENVATTEVYEPNVIISSFTEQEPSELQTSVTKAPSSKEEKTDESLEQDAVSNAIGDSTTSISTIEHDVTAATIITVEEVTKSSDSTGSSQISDEIVTKVFETSDQTTLRTPIIENEIRETTTKLGEQNAVTNEPDDFTKETNLEPHYPSSTSAPAIDDEFVTTEVQELATDRIKETEYVELQHVTASTPMLEEIEKDTTEYIEPEQVIPSDAIEDKFNILSTTVSNIAVVEQSSDVTESPILEEHISEGYLPGTTNIPVFDQQEQTTTRHDNVPVVPIDSSVKESSKPEEIFPSTTISDLIDNEKITTPSLGTAVSEYNSDRQESSSSTTTSAFEIEEATTEPDKGQNTIPSEGIEEMSLPPEIQKPIATVEMTTTEVDVANKFSTETEDIISSTVSDTSVSREEQSLLTTESAFRKEDYSPTEAQVSPKSTTVLASVTEEVISTLTHDHTKNTESILDLQYETSTTLVPKYTESVEETTLAKEISAVPEHAYSTSEASVSEIIPGKPTTITPLYEKETTTANQQDNEIFNEPRIPGEGDCLLNGVTYNNESTVPSTNKCQSGCKCVSSIIKCDPIICSPPPEYMDNCETMYDTPNACCPTYICDHKTETIPPQSHSQMSGTESPLISPVPCNGDECEISKDQKHHDDTSDACKYGNCASPSEESKDTSYPHSENIPETPTINEECVGEECKQVLCTDENGCQATPVQLCEGKKCETLPDAIVQPEIQQCAYGADCAVPNIPAKDCIGDACNTSGTQLEGTHTKEICSEKEGCLNIPQLSEDECKDDHCRRKDSPPIDKHVSKPCTAPDCTPSQIDTETSVTPALEQTSLPPLDQQQVDEDNKKDITETPENLESVTKATEPAYSVDTSRLPESHEIITKQPETTQDQSLTTAADIADVSKPESETTTKAAEYTEKQEITSSDFATEKKEPSVTEIPESISSVSTETTKKDSYEDISTTLGDVELEMTDKSITQEEAIDTERPQQLVTTEKSTPSKTSDMDKPTKIYTPETPTETKTTEPAEKHTPEDETPFFSEGSSTEPSAPSTMESHEKIKPEVDNKDNLSTVIAMDSSTEPPQFPDDTKKTETSKYDDTTITQESSTEPSRTFATDSEEVTKETEPTKSTSSIKDDKFTQDVPQSGTESATIDTNEQVGETDHTKAVSEPSKYDATTISAITVDLQSITVSKPSDATTLTEETKDRDTPLETTDKTVTEPSKPFITESLEITKSSESFDQEVTTDKVSEKTSTEPSYYDTEKQHDITSSLESEKTTVEVNDNVTKQPKPYTETDLDTKSPEEIERDGNTSASTETAQTYTTEPKAPESVSYEKTTVKDTEESSSEPSKIYNMEEQQLSEKSDDKDSVTNIYEDSSETSVTDSHMIPVSVDQKVTTLETSDQSSTESINVYPIEQQEDSKSPVEMDQENTTNDVLDESITEPPKTILLDTDSNISNTPKEGTTSEITQATEEPLIHTTKSQDSSKSSEDFITTTVKVIIESSSEPSKDEVKHEPVTLNPITEGPFVDSETPEIITISHDMSTSKSDDLTTPPSISDSKITPQEEISVELTDTTTSDIESKLPQTEGGVVKEQVSTTPVPTDQDIVITSTPISSDSEQTYHPESTPKSIEQETQKPDIETQTIPSPTPALEETSQTDLDATKLPEKAISTEETVTEQIDNEIPVPEIKPTESDELRTTPSEIQDLTTPTTIETSQLPLDGDMKTEYPDISYTSQKEQSTENMLNTSQDIATEEISTEKLISPDSTDKPTAATNADFTKANEFGTESSPVSSESEPAIQESYTEEPISKYSSPKPFEEYDSTKKYPDDITVEPVYQDSKEPEKHVDGLIQSLVTEPYETDIKPSDFEKDSQTQTPIQISSKPLDEDIQQTPQQGNVRDELSTPPSILAETTVKEMDDKVITSTEYNKRVDEVRTESPSYIDKIETTTHHLLEDSAVTQEPSVPDQNIIIASTIKEHISTTEHADTSVVDRTTEPIALDVAFTEQQELIPSDKPSVDVHETSTEFSYTTELSEKDTESAPKITKVPDVQIQTETSEAVTTESPEMPLDTEMSKPISEEHGSTLEDQRTTEASEPDKKPSKLTTIEPSTEIEVTSSLEPTIAPKQEYSEGTSSPFEDFGHTDKPEKEITEAYVTGDFTTETASSERYTEKQPVTLQTVTPEKATPIEEFVTTKVQPEPEVYQTTAPDIEVVNEISTRPSVLLEEGSTTLTHDIEQKPQTDEQSIPVVISTSEESIAVPTERVIPASEKPIQETTAPEEEFIVATSKATTVKAEEISTLSPSLDITTKSTDTSAESYSTAVPDESITAASEGPIYVVPEEPVTTVSDVFVTSTPEIPEAEAAITKTPEALVTTEPEVLETKTSETPITNAPEEPKTPVTIASEAPITNVSEAPEEPIKSAPESITEAPEYPITDRPEAPITSAPRISEPPISSASEAPISSEPEAAITDAYETPITSAPDVSEPPISSETEAPISNVPEAPVTNASEAPFTKAPEVPEESISSEPEAPFTNLPETPTTITPEALNTKAPEEPMSNLPEESITSTPEASPTVAPEAPITNAPELPVTAAPEQPVTAASELPVTAAPELPVTAAPELPVTAASELPVTATPELPKPVSTDAQPTDDVLPPDEEGSFPPSAGTSGYGQEPDYVEEDQTFGPGTCRYGGKVYVSAQQIPRDDPCDFCFCFRSDIICLQQSCPPPIHGCHEEPIQGFCCPRYECPVSMATTVNVTTTTTTTTTTLPPHFPTHSYKGSVQKRGCQIKGQTYKVGEVVRASSGPCLHCTCGGDGQMKCDPKVCTPEPMLRQMIAAAVSAKRRR